jgi:hypothetical protein
MGAGLDRSPVVAGGDDNGVDTVHDALVVRRRPIRVDGGEGPGLDDPVAHALAGELGEGQRRHGNPAAAARQATVGQVRQNAQVNSPAGDRLQARGQPLGGGVGGVGAHGVARIVDQVHDQHRPDGRIVQQVHLEIAGATAQALQNWIDLIGLRQNRLSLRQHGPARRLRVRDVEHLHLGDHLRGRRLGLKAASLAGEAGHVGGAGDDRWFFDRHRHQDVAAVDLEVHGDAQGQAEDADNVLDHLVGLVRRKPGLAGQGGEGVNVERSSLGQAGQALRPRSFVEAGEAGGGRHAKRD